VEVAKKKSDHDNLGLNVYRNDSVLAKGQTTCNKTNTLGLCLLSRVFVLET